MSILQLQQFEELKVTTKQVAQSIRKNPQLSKVLHFVQTGWPTQCDPELHPYFNQRNELTIEENCLLKGMQVIVPPDLQQTMVKLLHETHSGVIKMKALARSYVWWPEIDKTLEQVTKNCVQCQQHHKEEPNTPLHPLEFTTKPWQRIHLDFAGPFMDKMWLIIVDSYSKWPEVVPMKSTTASRTIEELRLVFARFGLPEQIITDNGPQFVAEEFQHFAKANGIRHTTVAPYHPRSNGL